MACTDSSGEETRSQPRAKKPYQKPSFRFEEVFVTSALTCGKITSTQTGCNLNLSAS